MTSKEICNTLKCRDLVSCLQFSPDGAVLAAGIGKKGPTDVDLWDLATGQLRHTLKGHFEASVLVLSPDGSALASWQGKSKSIDLWDVNKGQSRGLLEGHTGVVRWVCFSADGSLLASASADSTIRLWNAATGRLLRTLVGQGGTGAKKGKGGPPEILSLGLQPRGDHAGCRGARQDGQAVGDRLQEVGPVPIHFQGTWPAAAAVAFARIPAKLRTTVS